MRKKAIPWLIGILALSGAIVGSAAWYADSQKNAKKEVIEKAENFLLNRTCEPAGDSDCAFSKRLSAAVVGSAYIYDSKEDMLRYAHLSSRIKSAEYSKAEELIEAVLGSTDNDADKAVNILVNNYSPLRHNPKFDVDVYFKEMASFKKKKDHSGTVGMVFGVVALVAGGILTLIGLWALFLAMIRSLRRAWINPNG